MNEASTTIYLNIPITQTELQGLPPADRFTHVGSTQHVTSGSDATSLEALQNFHGLKKYGYQ